MKKFLPPEMNPAGPSARPCRSRPLLVPTLLGPTPTGPDPAGPDPCWARPLPGLTRRLIPLNNVGKYEKYVELKMKMYISMFLHLSVYFPLH